MVAFDDNRRRYRFTLWEAPDSNGKSSLVIAASSRLPTTIFDQSQPPSGHARIGSSPTLSRPALPKFGVYFQNRNILLRDGIKPTLRTSNPSPDAIALKLHATDTDDISAGVLNSRLNQRQHPICLFINIPATFDAGFTWTSLGDAVIGTPKVPLPPTFFHRAIDISGSTPVEHWLSPLPTRTEVPLRHDLPVSSPPPTDLSESQADARVQQVFETATRPSVLTEEADLPDAEDDENDQYDPAMDTAFAHLLSVRPPSRDSTPPALTPDLYAALSMLSHTHPWSLTFDLKALLPELDRRFQTFLIAGLSLPEGPAALTTGHIFNCFLYNFARSITDILAPPNSDIPLPDIDPVFFSPDFWYAHLVYASDLASPQGLQASAIDTLAGDQLCQWSVQGVNNHSLLCASHLTVFLRRPARPALRALKQDYTANSDPFRYVRLTHDPVFSIVHSTLPASAPTPASTSAVPPPNPALAEFLARRPPPSLPKSAPSRSRTPAGTSPASTPRNLEGPPVPAPQSKGKGKGKLSYRDAVAQQHKGQAKGKNKGKYNPRGGKGPIGK